MRGTTDAERRWAAARLAALALCFLAGLLLGQVLSRRLDGSTQEELRRYLSGYWQLERPAVDTRTVLSALVIYFRYPLAAMVLGLSGVGVVLVPAVTAVYGLSLSFSAGCFAAAYGRSGVALAVCAFGLRCLVTLPCYFLLAGPAWSGAAGLAARALGDGRRVSGPVWDRAWWQRCGLCAGVLLIGVCLELALSPALMELALAGLLT